MKKRSKVRGGALAVACLAFTVFCSVGIAQKTFAETPGEGAGTSSTSGGSGSAQSSTSSGSVIVIDPTMLAGTLSILPGSIAVIDFGSHANLVLPGDFTNSGTLYAISSNPNVTAANFSSANFFNQQGALFTTMLPQGGLAGFSNLVNNLSLNLTALNNVVNNGTISSAGNLSIIAGGNITNGTSAIISATNAVNLQAANIFNSGNISSQLSNSVMTTADLNNTGNIQAAMGNITVQSLLNTLSVVSHGGSFQAADNITFKTLTHLINEDATPGAALDLVGGDLKATNIIFDSVKGSVTVDARTMDGSVQANGAIGAFNVNEGSMTVGTMAFTGDPIVSAPLDLDLSVYVSTSQAGADFIALAGRDIFSSLGGSIDVATGGPTPSARIELQAGVTYSGGTVTGVSGRGGDINLSGVNLRTNSNTITAYARAGSERSGNINLGSVDASGSGGVPAASLDGNTIVLGPGPGSGGNIYINAASNINTGAIRTYGGGGGGGWSVSGGPTSAGQNGGHGGNIDVLSANGSVSISGEVNTSGGGGGGTVSDQAGNGGNAGYINIQSGTAGVTTSQVNIGGPVLAAGGGGGGGGGSGRSAGGGSFGGGGGAGGSGAGIFGGNKGRAGFGGGIFGGGPASTSGANTFGGGGGYFGGGGGDANGNGIGGAGIYGAGGYRSAAKPCCNYSRVFGQSGFTPNLTGGVAGDIGQAATTSQGGAAGNGGSIHIRANATGAASVNISRTIGSYFGVTEFTNSPWANYSIVTTGTGRIDALVSAGGGAGTINTLAYTLSANYSSTTNKTYLVTIGGGTPNSVTVAGRMLTSNGIQLPDRNLSGPQDVTGGTFAVPGIAGYNNTSGFVPVVTGDFLTPAEWVAMVQIRTFGTQSLVIQGPKGSGFAVGGSLDVRAANVPGGGQFEDLGLPSGVNLYSYVPTLIYNSSAGIDGTVHFDPVQTGSQTNSFISTPINGTGRINAPGSGVFTIQGVSIGSTNNRFLVSTDNLAVNSTTGDAYLKTDPGRTLFLSSMTAPNTIIDISSSGEIKSFNSTASSVNGAKLVVSTNATAGVNLSGLNITSGTATFNTTSAPISVGTVSNFGGLIANTNGTGLITAADITGGNGTVQFTTADSFITTGLISGQSGAGGIQLITTNRNINTGALSGSGVRIQTTGAGNISTGGGTGTVTSFNGEAITLSTGSGEISTGDIIGTGNVGIANTLDTHGGKGSDVSISTTGKITTGNILAGGGGGAGGGSCCTASAKVPGIGGNAGSIIISGGIGNIQTGQLNASGGGGGGGGSILSKGFPGSVGAEGGNGGTITVTSTTGDILITGPVLAAGGGGGGSGTNEGGGYAGGGGSYSSNGGNGNRQLGGGGSISSQSGGVGTANGLGKPALDIWAGPGGAVGAGGGGSDTLGSGNGGGKGGNITLSNGALIDITGQIAGGSAFAGDSINAYGSAGSGSVQITSLATGSVNPTYFQDANYGAGASTYAAVVTAGSNPVGFQMKGAAHAGSITINGTSYGNNKPAAPTTRYGGYSVSFVESGVTRQVFNGTMVTPAEWVAIVQSTLLGTQSLTITGNLGQGGASAGSFDIAASNVPSGDFTSLQLPTGVTMNSALPSLTYGGPASVNDGQITFSGANNTLNVSSLSGNGSIASNNLTLNATAANGSLGTAAIPLSINAPIIAVSTSSGGSAYILDSTTGGAGVTIKNSTVQNVFSLQANSTAPGTGNINTATGESISAGTLVLVSDKGNIGNSALKTNAEFITTSAANGSVSVEDSFAGIITIQNNGSAMNQTNPTTGVYTFKATDTAGGINSKVQITAPRVSLEAGTGGIDISLTGNLTASELTVQAATGSVGIRNVGPGANLLTLHSSSAKAFRLNNVGLSSSITSDGAINAQSIDFKAGTGGIFLVNAGSINADTVKIETTGQADIVDTHNGQITITASSASSFQFNAKSGTSGITGGGLLSALSRARLTAGSGGINYTGANTINTPILAANSTGAVSIVNVSNTNINLEASSGSSFSLEANAADSGIIAAGKLSAPTANLKAGSLGVNFSGINTLDANNLTVASTGDVLVEDSYAGIVGLQTSSSGVGKSFSLTATNAAGGIQSNGILTTDNATLSAGTGGIAFAAPNYLHAPVMKATSTGTVSIENNYAGNISLGASSATSFSLTASETAGGITGTGALNAPTAVLKAGTGGINFTGTNTLNASSLTANSTGVVSITDTHGGLIDLSKSSGSSFTLDASFFNSGIKSSGTLSSSTVNLKSGSSGIDFTGSNTLDASSLKAYSDGVVSITDTHNGVITLESGSFSGKSFTLNASGAASGIFSNGVLGSPTVDFTAGTKGIDFTMINYIVSKDVSAVSTGKVMIVNNHNGAITIQKAIAPNLLFSATGTGSSVTGSIDAETVDLYAQSGGINFTGANSLNSKFISAQSTGGTVDINATNASVTLNAGKATTFTLTAPNGEIIVNGKVDASVGLNLLASDKTVGNISSTATGLLSGGAADLQANGTVGIGTAASPLLTSVATIRAEAPNGSVHIKNSRVAGTQIVGASSALNNFSVEETQGGLTIGTNISAGSPDPAETIKARPELVPDKAIKTTGSIILTAAGNLDLGAGRTLTTYGGSKNGTQVPGSIILLGDTVTGGAGNTLTAMGGEIIINGGTSVSIDGGGTATFEARSTVSGGKNAGGAISITTGMSLSKIQSNIETLMSSRVYPSTQTLSGGTYTGSTFKLSNGSSFISKGSSNVFTNNTVEGSGGVMYIENASVQNLSIGADGVSIPQPPPTQTETKVTINSNTGGNTSFSLLALLNSFNPLIGDTVSPLDKAPIRGEITDSIDESSTVLQGAVGANGDDAIGAAIFSGSVFDQQVLAAMQNNGVKLGQNSGVNFLNLDQGIVLFAPTKDTVVQTHEGNVYIPAGSIALVYETGNDVAVYDFVDSFGKPIQVESGGSMIPLQPGQQLVLSRSQNARFDSINPGNDVGYRDISVRKLDKGITAYISDFSIPSALVNHEPCRMLRKSKDSSHRDTLQKIMKTTAAVQLVTMRKGPYKLRGKD